MGLTPPGSTRAARGVQEDAEQLEAAKGARLEVSGARRPRDAEQLEAAKGCQTPRRSGELRKARRSEVE